MHLDTWTFIPPEARTGALHHLSRLIGDPQADPTDLMERLNQALERQIQAGALQYFQGEQPVPSAEEADAVQFDTGLTTPKGEAIVARCTANRRPGGQKWFGLIFQVVPRPGFAIGDLYFPSWHDGPRFLEEVATLAIPEKWTYTDYASKQKYPILRSYLAKTYERLQQQERLVRASGQILFNTGLINRWFKEIYMMGHEDPAHPGVLLDPRPLLENDRTLLETFGNNRPPMATYFEHITDAIFDPNLDVITDDVHIIEDNFERIPEEYRRLRRSQIFALFQSAVEFARIMARRNYKLVVPQFYNGRIQFLMPIYLSGEFTGTPDCALALERMSNCYRGNTILTLDMAYQNARLIAKPDPTWLNPDTIAVAEDELGG